MNSRRDPLPFKDIPDPLGDGGIGEPLPARPMVRKGSDPWATVGIRRGVAIVAALLSQLVWVELLARRTDFDTSPRTRIALEILLPLATAAIAFWAAEAHGRWGLGNTRGRIAATLAAAVALFAGGVWLFTAFEEADPIPFWFHVARCASYTTAFATVPFALALWFHARTFATLSSWRTCALGVACGAIGACSMSFICETESAAHVIIGHGLAMVIAGLVGALAARSVTAA